MEAYFPIFVNFEQEDWLKLLPIVEFANYNAKKVSTGYTSFELNYSCHPRAFCKKNVNHQF